MKHAVKQTVTGIALLCMACAQNAMGNTMEKKIDSGWSFQQVDGKLSGKATVPGTIHTDLLNEGIIEDPFYRTNEKDLQWIDKEDWVYSTEVTVSKEELEKDRLQLHFDGLDTYADVFFNETKILSADNMFREWEADIKSLAKVGENTLRIHFHSPIKKGLALLEKSEYAYPAVNDQSENGELGDKKVSVFTRKAGYHYGWDWGPRFVTSGIWRPIHLRAWNQGRIESVFIQQPKVNAELAELVGEVSLTMTRASKAVVRILDKQSKKIMAEEKIKLSKGQSTVSLPFQIKNPKLWWSAGLGEPTMYAFETQVEIDGKIISQTSTRTGLRSIELVREKDKWGESFVFELNGVRVFAKGANYIPNDSFLPRVTAEDYKKVIADAVDANMNMLRVWGGGIYENDLFYDLCDENGIMVWQDFMFACSMYPGDEAFLESIRKEATDNVVRLRNHPSIAVWCGNNEMNTAWHQFGEGGWGWKELYTEAQKETIYKAYEDIFHKVLPQVLEATTDGDDYWPSSPQAGYEPPKHASYETTSGDMHYWGVWHGLHKFEDFDKYKSRFMSEYGFQSFPDFETVKTYTTPEDYDIESEVMSAHQRSGIGNLRIREYMSWDYEVPTNFEDFLYMSHVLQARGMRMGIEAHRRAMPYCMGSLYWQINDCWPVASWSSTDYYHKWKAMHYAVRHAYKPILLAGEHTNDVFKLYVVSDKLEEIAATLSFDVLSLSGERLHHSTRPVSIGANTSTLLLDDKDSDALLANFDPKKTMIVVTLNDKQGTLLAENNFYLCKPKEMELEKPKVEMTLKQEQGKQMLLVSSDKLVKDFYIQVADKEVRFNENYFDIVPGKEYRIALSGKDAKTTKVGDIKSTHLYKVVEAITNEIANE